MKSFTDFLGSLLLGITLLSFFFLIFFLGRLGKENEKKGVSLTVKETSIEIESHNNFQTERRLKEIGYSLENGSPMNVSGKDF